MGVVTFKLEAEEAKAVRAYLKVVDAQSRAERGARKLGDAGKRSGKAVVDGADKGGKAIGGLEKKFDKFVKFSASAAGAAVLVKGWKAVEDQINATAAAQEKIARGNRTLLQEARSVQVQEGEGTTIGQATSQITAIMKAGPISDPAKARLIAEKTDIKFGFLGKEGEAEVAAVFAQFSERANLEAEQAASIITTVEKFGARNIDDIKLLLEQVTAGALKADLNISQFLRGGQQAFPVLTSAGATPELSLGLLTAGKEIRGTALAAAESAIQLVQTIGKKSVRKLLSQKLGVTEKDFLGLSFNQQFFALADTVSTLQKTPEGLLELGKALDSAELVRTKAFLTDKNVGLVKGAMELAKNVKPEQFDRRQKTFEGSPIFPILKSETETFLAKSEASDPTLRGQSLLDTAAAIRDRINAGEDVSKFDLSEQDARDLYTEFFFRLGKGEQEAVALKRLRNKAKKVERGLIDSGDIKLARFQGGGQQPTLVGQSELGDSFVDLKRSGDLHPNAVFDRNPAEIGEIAILLAKIIEQLSQGNDKLINAVENQSNDKPAPPGPDAYIKFRGTNAPFVGNDLNKHLEGGL